MRTVAEQAADIDLTDVPPIGGRTRTEYGVLVDNRASGLGVRLVRVTEDIGIANEVAQSYRDSGEGPVGVRQRRVHVTDWRPVAPQGGAR